jgi:hypothetical protein
MASPSGCRGGCGSVDKGSSPTGASTASSTTTTTAQSLDDIDSESNGGLIRDDHPVTLDIGGRLFKTHRSTLTSQSGYFRTMFDTRYHFAEASKKSTAVFIDRNPDSFAHILEFLRDPGYVLPHTLERELEWYQIKSPWASGVPWPSSLSTNDKAWLVCSETLPTFVRDTVEQWQAKRVQPPGHDGPIIALLATGSSDNVYNFFTQKATRLDTPPAQQQPPFGQAFHRSDSSSATLPSVIVRPAPLAPWRGSSCATSTHHAWCEYSWGGHAKQVKFSLPVRTIDALQRVTWVFPCVKNVPAGVYRYMAWTCIRLVANGVQVCRVTPELMRMLDVLQYTPEQRQYRDELEQSAGEIHMRLPLWFDPDLYGSYKSLAKSTGTSDASCYLSHTACHTNLDVCVDWAAHATPEGMSSGSLGYWTPPSYIASQGLCMTAIEREFLGRLASTSVHVASWSQSEQRVSGGSRTATVRLSQDSSFCTDLLFCVVDEVTRQFLPVEAYAVHMSGITNVSQSILALRHQQLAAWGSMPTECVYHHSWDQTAMTGHRTTSCTLQVTFVEPCTRPCTVYVCQMQHSIGRYVDGFFLPHTP